MCGIVGIFNTGSRTLAQDIIKMLDIIVYRGPDGSGSLVFQEEGFAFGHRRLSILDLSDLGAQPMTYQKERLLIVHNGEVYNYIEIRSELEQMGYVFKSHTDTEVILAAYDKWGSSCLEKFNGMFAFAVLDKEKKELFLARDRLGIKPLYYYTQDDIFVFASEIKAILEYLKVRPEINTAAVDAYMSFGYVPGEETMFKGIKRLLPGHYIIRKHNGIIQKRRYWDFQFGGVRDEGVDYYIDELKRLFNKSIDLRLRSDVPLGIFLSGGLDSSAVVAMLAPRVSERLKTFSVAYDFGSDFNETNYARKVARQFNTEHHEFVVSPTQFKEFIPQYIWHMDEPVTESAAISLYYIAKMAKQSVTVVLSGEGSDEIFAGYDFYYYNKIIEAYRNLVGANSASFWGRRLSALLPSGKVRKYLQMSQLALDKRYKGVSTYEDDIKALVYSNEFRDKINQASSNSKFLNELFQHTNNNDALSRMLYFDTKTWLVDDLLIKADRMTMATSLELRVPFLDHHLVEFAAKMPSKYKLRGKTHKYILKKTMQGTLPDEIINRKKMGFPTPLHMMFRNELHEYAFDILLSDKFSQRGYFKGDVIEKILTSHRNGIQDNHRLIWQFLVLEEWHRRFIDV